MKKRTGTSIKMLGRILLLRIIGIMILGIFIYPCNVYAESGIQCSYEVSDRIVNLSGQVPGVQGKCQVSILVGSEDNIIHIDQITSSEGGSFTYSFKLSETLDYGQYPLKIGSNAGAVKYSGTLNFTPQPITRQFINADATVTVNNYVPTITGTLYCIEGKTTTIKIANSNNGNVIVNDTITSENGIYYMSYELPRLVFEKYDVTISCTEGDKVLASVNVTIDSSVFVMSVEGTAHVADNVRVDGSLQTTGTDLISKNISVTSDKTISTKLPNIVPNMSFHFTVGGYETVETLIAGETLNGTYTVSGTADTSFLVGMNVKNVVFTDNGIFTVEYNPAELEVTDLCGFTSKKEQTSCIVPQADIEIISVGQGKVMFRLNKELLKIQGDVSTVVNVMEFRKLTNSNSIIVCKMAEESEAAE